MSEPVVGSPGLKLSLEVSNETAQAAISAYSERDQRNFEFDMKQAGEGDSMRLLIATLLKELLPILGPLLARLGPLLARRFGAEGPAASGSDQDLYIGGFGVVRLDRLRTVLSDPATVQTILAHAGLTPEQMIALLQGTLSADACNHGPTEGDAPEGPPHVVYGQPDRMAMILNVFGLTPTDALRLVCELQRYNNQPAEGEDPATGYTKETYGIKMSRVEGALRVLGLRLSEAREVLSGMVAAEEQTP